MTIAASMRVDMAIGGSFRQLVDEDEPIAWYRFAEQSGSTTARDSSGNGYHGTAAGGITFEVAPTVPEGGFAYQFDGVNAAVSVSTVPFTGSTVTFEAWIKPNTPTALGTILSDGGDVSASASGSPSASRSPSVSVSASASPSRSPSASLSPSVSASSSQSPSTSRSPSVSTSSSASPSASPSASRSPSVSASASGSPSRSPSASLSPSASISPSRSSSASQSPSTSRSPSASASPSASISPSPSAGAEPNANFIGLHANRTPTVFFGSTHHLASSALADATWSHLVISISAGTGTFYINGVSAGTFSSFTGFTPKSIGLIPGGAYPLKGWLDELVIYPTALSASRVLEHYAAGFWTDVSDDLVAAEELTLKFGIGGNGPQDRLSDLGVLSFSMRNDAGNSGGLQGYYSPLHVNCRSGFSFGTLTRVIFTYSAVEYPRFMGKIFSVDPAPGRYRTQRVKVTVHDLIDDLIEADLRNVTVQASQSEDDLLVTLLDALPITAQPLALSLDAGLDTYPLVFDDLAGGVKAIGPASDLTMSALGFLHMGPSGVLRYENRQARQLISSSYSFDDDMTGLAVPTTLDGVFNHVRATFHPKTTDTAATTVLWSSTGTVAVMSSGETVVVWGDYYNPSNTREPIGGIAQVTPVATTDYLSNTAADGSGVDKTANLVVTAEYFASTAKFTVTNNDVSAVYVTKLQIRGKGIYDHSPQTVESMNPLPYGDRVVEIDLPYQNDPSVTQDLADYVRSQFEILASQAQSIEILPQRSDTHMLAALGVFLGDRITISETVTGLVMVDTFIHSIQFTVTQGTWIVCTFGLAAATYFNDVWVMDDPALSLVETSTVFGFA